jgi:hypothetical protein
MYLENVAHTLHSKFCIFLYNYHTQQWSLSILLLSSTQCVITIFYLFIFILLLTLLVKCQKLMKDSLLRTQASSYTLRNGSYKYKVLVYTYIFSFVFITAKFYLPWFFSESSLMGFFLSDTLFVIVSDWYLQFNTICILNINCWC